MYQARRTAESHDATPRIEADTATAFSSAPRRAARSRVGLLRNRIAPTVVSVALLATSGVFAMNLGATEGTTAVPAPVREDDATSRDAARELVETESLSTDTAEAAPAESTTEAAPSEGAEAFVGGTWASAFGTPAGQKFAQKAVPVRAQATADSAKLGTVAKGAKVAVTDRVVDGWRQIAYEGKVGYVDNTDLGDKAPPKEAPKPAAKAATAGAAKAETYTGATTYSGKSVLGLKPQAMVVYNAVTARWSFSSIGGYRASSLSNHQLGGAIDFMLTPGKDSAKGWAVANYLAANASAFGIDHIIFEQKIWTPYKPTWRAMASRGSITANHYDHVHVSVKL
ncbi:MAG: SH3 domain-containing protein [Actinomycetes bacterium]